MNLKTGFYSDIFERTLSNTVRETVVIFRGTENWRDWVYGNLTIGKFPLGATQYDDAWRVAQEVRAATTNRIVFVGHSLGGGLAEYVQRLTSDSIAITFNGSPNRGFLYSLGRKKEAKESLRLFERGEALQSFRWLLSPLRRSACEHRSGKRARWFDFMGRWGVPNIISQHDMADFSMNLVKLAVLADDPNMEEVFRTATEIEKARQK